MKNKLFPIFTILMCVYNQTDLLDNAICSVLDQNETSWELLVLDNSDFNRDATWTILNCYAKQDVRVHIFRNDKNEGWAKGTAWLLKHASGIYMSFLAADDFLLPDALEKVRTEIEQENPDIIWVGNGFYQYMNHELTKIGRSVLTKKNIVSGKQASHIKYIMENTFYNSMFHYEKISFLRKNKIDFFEPYYGDCVGMVKAMAEAEKMLILDCEVYGLVANTSQTREKYFWNGIQYIFIPQWKCIKDAYIRDAFFSFQEARFCSMAILRPVVRGIEALLDGAICINREMNPVIRNSQERMVQIEEILQHPMIQEMVQLYGRFEFEKEILEILDANYIEFDYMGTASVSVCRTKRWLVSLLELDKMIICRNCGEIIEDFINILTAEDNVGMMGMGLFLQFVKGLSDEEVRDHMDGIQIILQAYDRWKHLFVERVFSEFRREHVLEGQSRVELAAFCKYILEN